MKKAILISAISAAVGALVSLLLIRAPLELRRVHDHAWELRLPPGHFVNVLTPDGRNVQVMSVDGRVATSLSLPGNGVSLGISVSKETAWTMLTRSDGWSYLDRDGDGLPETRMDLKSKAWEKLIFQTVAIEKTPNQISEPTPGGVAHH